LSSAPAGGSTNGAEEPIAGSGQSQMLSSDGVSASDARQGWRRGPVASTAAISGVGTTSSRSAPPPCQQFLARPRLALRLERLRYPVTAGIVCRAAIDRLRARPSQDDGYDASALPYAPRQPFLPGMPMPAARCRAARLKADGRSPSPTARPRPPANVAYDALNGGCRQQSRV
jgi:hypothetical protein